MHPRPGVGGASPLSRCRVISPASSRKEGNSWQSARNEIRHAMNTEPRALCSTVETSCQQAAAAAAASLLALNKYKSFKGYLAIPRPFSTIDLAAEERNVPRRIFKRQSLLSRPEHVSRQQFALIFSPLPRAASTPRR